ncbi:MAG TPA: DUF1573 domain-containing protein [Actinobacteria bacterium]|nr:DUF1573 domain-containing protein [Actinomycetes bacterium]HEX21137.1 DUF1573 domain-containing protein [Actinomycetota bacterium]
MSEIRCENFQENVDKYLVRHRSILDVITKLQDSVAHTNRSIIKAVTSCGCLEIKALKQPIPKDVSLEKLSDYVRTHLEGELCPDCLDKVEAELGKTLFYLTALCSLLKLDLGSIIDNENDRISTLGIYSLT